MDHPEHHLTRTDFDTAEDWARHCHEGGVPPEYDGRGRMIVEHGHGPYSELRRAIFGVQPGVAKATRRGLTTTNGLSRYGFEALIYASAYSCWRGRFMSCHLVITWSMMGITTDPAVTHLNQEFADALRRWLQRETLFEGYFWVLERSGKRGLHSHFLAAVPPNRKRALEAWVIKWLSKKTGRVPLQSTETKAVFVRAEWVKNSREQRIWLKYIIKGGDGTYSMPGVPLRAQGGITGKRYGIARCLDEYAQRCAGFPRIKVAPYLTGEIDLDDSFDRGHNTLNNMLSGL